MRTMTNIFGTVLLLIGVLGFIPWLAPNQELMGAFQATAFNNVFYIISALAAFWAGSLSTHASRNFFRIFGAIYLGLALIGFLMADGGYILGVIAQNGADNWLHLVLALVALFFGFSPRSVAAHGTLPGSP